MYTVTFEASDAPVGTSFSATTWDEVMSIVEREGPWRLLSILHKHE